MVLNWLFAIDSFLPLPAVGLKGFVEGAALHTSRRSVIKGHCPPDYPLPGVQWQRIIPLPHYHPGAWGVVCKIVCLIYNDYPRSVME